MHSLSKKPIQRTPTQRTAALCADSKHLYESLYREVYSLVCDSVRCCSTNHLRGSYDDDCDVFDTAYIGATHRCLKTLGDESQEVVGKLLRTNHSILCMLVSNDSIVERADTFIRRVLENYQKTKRKKCNFMHIIYMFVTHFDKTRAIEGFEWVRGEAGDFSAPRGLDDITKGYLVRIEIRRAQCEKSYHTVVFRTLKYWAAFLACSGIWQSLPEQPSFHPNDVYRGR